MGTCRFCGRDAGLLRSAHTECEAPIRDALRSYLSGGSDLTALEATARTANAFQNGAAKDLVVGDWENAVGKALEDGVLSEDEEKRLASAASVFGVSQGDLDHKGRYTQVGKANVLRRVMAGEPPTNVQIEGSPFNLQRDRAADAGELTLVKRQRGRPRVFVRRSDVRRLFEPRPEPKRRRAK